MRLKSLLIPGCLFLFLATTLFVLLANKRLRVTDQHNTVRSDGVSWHTETDAPEAVIYQPEENPSPSIYYCNFPSDHDEATAEEGKPPNSNWVLKQVQVLIRHGDRSPIGFELYKKLNVKPRYCQIRPDHHPTHPSLAQFMKSMSVDHARMMMEGIKLFTSPFPRNIICKSAALSQLGVVQHIRNGEILRKSYLQDHKFLAEAIQNRASLNKKIHVVSTTTSRTVQSAIAFLYGLIPDFHLDEVEIKYSKSDIFSSTRCAAATLLEQNIKNKKYKIYIDRQKTNSTFRKLADTFGINDHSGVLIDSFVTGFLCKNYKLPCLQNQSCVTVEDLDILLKEEEYMMKKLSEETHYVNQSILRLHPLLDKIVGMMTKKISNDDKASDVVIISGHDTTLKPLIRCLGIPEYRWPRLGTRLVFELWFDPDNEQHFIRILLNGKDYTMQTNFCKRTDKDNPSTICDFKKFSSYIKSEIFGGFKGRTRDELCNTAFSF